MDYRDFISRDSAYNAFIKMRRSVLESVDRGNFADTFTDLCATALMGDCVAQDVVAYFFNKGVEGLLQPNYEYYMSWQILAGANGNEFALEKLEFFLNPALEPIIDSEEVLTTALKNRTITKNNAIMVISNLICEGVVDELHIDPKNLIEIKNQPSTYTARKNRMFLDAIDRCLPKVVNFLMS